MEKDDHSFDEIFQTEEAVQVEERVQVENQTSAINWDILDSQVTPQIEQRKRKRTIQLIASSKKIKGCTIEYWPNLYPVSKSGELLITLVFDKWENGKKVL